MGTQAIPDIKEGGLGGKAQNGGTPMANARRIMGCLLGIGVLMADAAEARDNCADILSGTYDFRAEIRARRGWNHSKTGFVANRATMLPAVLQG